MSKITSKYEDKRAREEPDKRTNETADRYMCWDVDHHIFGLHFAARHTMQCTHAACTIQRACRRATARDWGLWCMDVKMAFLQSDLAEDLYMRMPPNLPNKDAQGRALVCKLMRPPRGTLVSTLVHMWAPRI